MTGASWHEVGLMRAVADLEALRDKLGAERLRAEWPTEHGQIVVSVPGPVITVDGATVPMGDA